MGREWGENWLDRCWQPDFREKIESLQGNDGRIGGGKKGSFQKKQEEESSL